MRLLAIDPGNTESGWVIIDTDTRRPLHFGKTENHELLEALQHQHRALSNTGHAVIEMVASYGMAVGADVFETCVWIGRFQQALTDRTGTTPELVKRQPVKLHHCHSPKAKDANVRQALVDRFAPGQPNHGKGTKAAPGWFYGFRADIWQAYALAVYAADQLDTSAAELGRTGQHRPDHQQPSAHSAHPESKPHDHPFPSSSDANRLTDHRHAPMELVEEVAPDGR